MNEERLKAFASVTFDNCFVVRNMKVVMGNKGVFLCMPSRKLADGTHKDMVHPITQEFRKYLEDNVLKAYEEELKRGSVPTRHGHQDDDAPTTSPACAVSGDRDVV
jgi:stage V sporulation protein G